MNNNSINDDSPCAPSINMFPDQIQQSENNISDKDWSYYDKNNDFLLRFGLIDKKNIIIRFEILITKTISDKNEMYAYSFKGKDLIEDLDYDRNLDAFTTLTLLFENNTPLGEINKSVEEFYLTISRKTGKYTFALMKQICNDKKFFSMNIKKKIKQIKQKIEDKFYELKKENENLRKKKKILKKN